MIRAFYIFIYFLASSAGYSQTEITWEDLKFKSTKKVWNEEFQAAYEVPQFTKKTKKLDSTKIIITGHFVPVDILSKYYVLSASEFHSFCGNSNQYDELIAVTMELDSNITTNDIVTLTGTLVLNADDIFQMNYILKDAKLLMDATSDITWKDLNSDSNKELFSDKHPYVRANEKGSNIMEITWEDLKCDTVVETWSEDFQFYYQVPHFTANTNKLNGKEISITGYFHSIDILDGYYELCKSEFITSYCYFAPRLETIEIQISTESTPKLNEQVTISGILRLNSEDILQNNFVLEDAKIVIDK